MRPRARRWTVLLGALGAGALIGLAVAARFEAGQEHVGRGAQDTNVDEGLTLQGVPRTTAAGAVEHAAGAPREGGIAGGGLRVDVLVVDAAGKPVPETTVVFVPAPGELRGEDFHAEGVEATEGRFRLFLDPVRRGWIAAFASAHLPTYVEVAPPGPQGSLRVVLEEALPFQVVLFGPDGGRFPGGSVTVLPAPHRKGTSPPGPEGPHIQWEFADADDQGEALLRVEDRGAIEVSASGYTERWPALESRPLSLERAEGRVELHLEPTSRIVIKAVDATTGEDILESLRVGVGLPPEGRPASPARVSHVASGRALVRGLLHGQVRLQIAADGYLPAPRIVTVESPGTRHELDVELERDPARGCMELAVPCTRFQGLEVLFRKRGGAHEPWTELFGRMVPAATEPDPSVSVPRRWRGQALAPGTYDLLILRFDARRPSAGDPAAPTFCAWLSGVPVEGRSITSRAVTPGPGLLVPVPGLGAATDALESLRVLGPEASPLPLFVYNLRWIRPGPSGNDDYWTGIELVPPDRTPAAGSLLGPYPFASITLELQPKNGPRETRVYDGR